MSRIGFVMTHPFLRWKNGADICAFQLAGQLEARGHECPFHLIVRDVDDAYRAPAGVTVHVLPRIDTSDPFRVLRETHQQLRDAVRALVAASSFDAVIIPWGSQPLARLVAEAGARTLVLVQNGESVATMTSDDYQGLGVAAMSPASAKDIAKQLGREPLVVLNPIEPAADDGADDDDERRDIGMVNICGEKGAIIFLNVAANLPSHRFVATGGWAGDAELYAKMATGLANVELLPPQDDMTSFYRRLRVLLVPSLWREAFGRVALEAQMHGVPVVCTDRCGAKTLTDGLVVAVPPRPPSVSADAYQRDAGYHATTIRKFLDAIVTLDDPQNYALLRTRARAAATRYIDLQQASVGRLERWVRKRAA
jgi:glycosyltransferase involved in cell wall biosynthesis